MLHGTTQFLSGAFLGVCATAIVDLWTLLLRGVFGIPLFNYCLLGRWFVHMRGGTLAHASITAAEPKHSECAIGWFSHYAIGALFGLAFIVLVTERWLVQPTLLPALLFGVGTVAFPYFLMQPAFGFGVAASKMPNPKQARLKSLLTHVVFGIGLYASAVVVSYLVPGQT